ncbi:hypothetical protein NEAUS03_0238 [Nematocida ausubeli]|nr:hypothetical protein NEAUS03_0238 [Nematocida ausubeli]
MTLLTIGVVLGVYIYNKKIHLKRNKLQGSGSTHKPLKNPSTVNKNGEKPTDVTTNNPFANDLNSSHEDSISDNSHEKHAADNLNEEPNSDNLYEDCNENIYGSLEEGHEQMKSSETNSTSKPIEEQKKSGFLNTILKPILNLFGSRSSTKDIAKDTSSETIMNTEVSSEEYSQSQQVSSEVDEESVMTKEEKHKNIFGNINMAYDNDYNIPAEYINNEETQKSILKCSNEVVIVEVYENSDHKKITLMNFLIEVSEKEKKNNVISEEEITLMILKCPSLFKEDKYMHRLLLSYYSRRKNIPSRLKMEGFSLADKNSDIFPFSELLGNINNLTLSNTVVSTDVLRVISEVKNLQVLKFTGKIEIVEENKTELKWSNIQKIDIYSMDSTSAQKILQSLGPRDKDLELSISHINFIPSSVINNIKCLDNIKAFELSDVIFASVPDFRFLGKMKSLHTLRLSKIMYSYTEQLNEDRFNTVYEDADFFNPTLQQLDDKNDLQSKEVSSLIENNKKIGAKITASNIFVDGRLYNDLGLCKLVVKEKATINVMFSTILKENISSRYSIEFNIDKRTKKVEIKSDSGIEACEEITNALKCISYPFRECSDVEAIYIHMNGKQGIQNKFAYTFINKLFEYSRAKNTVKNICIEANELYNMSTHFVDAFNQNFKQLDRLELKNISLFVSSSIKDDTENSLDEQTDISYTKVNDSIKDYLFERKSKTGNLEMVKPK